MKYENPKIELVILETQDVIRTSGLDGSDDYHVPGGSGGGSTSTSGKW